MIKQEIRKYMDSHDYRNAIPLLKDAMTGTHHPDVDLCMAVIHISGKEWQLAIDILTPLQDADWRPVRMLSRLLLGFAYYNTGNAADSNLNYNIYTALLLDRFTAKEFVELDNDFMIYYAAYPKNFPDLLTNWCYYLRGTKVWWDGNSEVKYALSAECIEWSLVCLFERVNTEAGTVADLEAGMECLNTAAELNEGNNAEIFYWKGELMYSTDKEKAVEYYKASITEDPLHDRSILRLSELIK